MKKFLALIIVLVLSLSTIGCSVNSKSIKTNEFDFGGIVIDIPEDFDITISPQPEMVERDTVQFMDDDNIISIIYWLGDWEPDEGIQIDPTDEIIKQDEYEIDGNQALYSHISYIYDDRHVYQQTLSIFMEDRWVIIQTASYNKETDVVLTSSMENVRISDNQFNFNGFNKPKTNNNHGIIDVNEPPELTMAPTPEPTPEPTNNPFLYEFYEYENVSVPIPINFFYNDEVSTSDKEVFHSDWDYTASFVVERYGFYTHPAVHTADSFDALVSDNGAYKQDYYTVVDNVVKSHITYTIGGQPYEDYDIVICLDDCTLVISMSGPAEYSEIFRKSFDYIGSKNQNFILG